MWSASRDFVVILTTAEEVGFEPTVGCPTHDFQSCRFGRSRTPPEGPDAIVSPSCGALERSGRVLRDGAP